MVLEPYAGWGLGSVYLVALMIFWTAVVAGLLALIRRLDKGHDPAPISQYEKRPRPRKAA